MTAETNTNINKLTTSEKQAKFEVLNPQFLSNIKSRNCKLAIKEIQKHTENIMCISLNIKGNTGELEIVGENSFITQIYFILNKSGWYKVYKEISLKGKFFSEATDEQIRNSLITAKLNDISKKLFC